ncbi:YciI family protein [Agrobacterium sp. lyk4-40-TYG-31]|uniref:YciI family protein n=1 Tax=Agrobacterium sp. lyk4-40-TYG-31 TaxID=3040276 RepID=UPI00254CA8B7|nr:YciI family protein [Agrobacterium sp. lyk4-40-TYG-31]
MLAIRIALSDPQKAEARLEHLEDHKRYLRSGRVDVLQSGPIDDGVGAVTGGVVVAEVVSLDDMHAFSAGDPFVINGVYNRVNVFEWKPTISNSR